MLSLEETKIMKFYEIVISGMNKLIFGWDFIIIE